MNVLTIVENWLKQNGYDGLYSDTCGCEIGDLMQCGEASENCEPGYKMPCPGPEDCEEGGMCRWHMGPKKGGD